MPKLRLMSHNIWNCDNNSPDWEKRGEDCSAEARVGGLLRVWRECDPDVIGMQEASAKMADLVMTGFEDERKNYILVWGRFTPILFKADKFDLIDGEFVTYPEELPGYEGSFNDVRSKSCNIAVLRVKESGKIFAFATTHLWWKKSPSDKLFSQGSAVQEGSDEAREAQIALLIKKVNEFKKKYSCPAILVGDFNTDYNSKAIKYALANGFYHAHNIATEYSDEAVGYHNCFPWGYESEYFDKPFEDAIDHILVSEEIKAQVLRFERYSPDYYFPISDHSAVHIDIEL